MKKHFLLLILTVFLYQVSQAQTSVSATGSPNPDGAAMLDVISSDKGFLLPRVSLTSTSVAAPVTGLTATSTSLLVYNTNTAGDVTPGFYFWNNNTLSWVRIISGSGSFPTGSGTTNYVARWTPNGNTLGSGSITDNGTRIGIGTTPHATYLAQVAGDVLLTSGYLRTTGTSGWTNETYGGGIFMQDATWIRTSGNKGFYHNTGNFRTDGTLQVGGSGATLNVPNTGNFAYKTNVLFANYTSGNIGLGTVTPITALDIQTGGTFRQKGYTEVITETLAAAATQAKRHEVARVSIDYNDWNSVGVIEIELHEKYWSSGIMKKYYVYYGYVSSSGAYLAEVGGSGGNNNFQVTVGSEVTVSGDQRYIPVYVDVRYYAQVVARIKTTRTLSTTNPPPIGQIWVNTNPTATDISDFTTDATVYMNNVSGFNTIFNQGTVGIGNLAGSGTRFVVANASGILSTGTGIGSGIITGSGTTNYVPKWTPDGATLGNSLIFDNGTNVGIGTTTPGAKLEVAGTSARVSSSSDAKFEFFGSSSDRGFVGWQASAPVGVHLLNKDNTPIYFGTTNAERMRIDAGGNVGIGIAPAAKFHVSGGGQILGTNGSSSNTRTLTILEDGDAQINFGSYPYDWSPAFQIQNNDNSHFLWISPGGSGGYSSYAARIMAAGSGLDIYANGSSSSSGTFIGRFVANGSVGTLNLGTMNDPSGDQGNNWLTWGYRSDNNPYYCIRTNYKTYGSNTYSRLQLNWHTGIEIGASTSYGGTRFYDNSPGVGANQIMSIGDGDGHVRVNNYLFASYLNSTDNSVGSGVTGVMVKQGDNYSRLSL